MFYPGCFLVKLAFCMYISLSASLIKLFAVTSILSQAQVGVGKTQFSGVKPV
jgi:hypothetical protein